VNPLSRAKKEIPHSELNKKSNRSKCSARYTKIGSKAISSQTRRFIALVDKVVYPANICPHCGSKATLHRRMQSNNDLTPNCLDAIVQETEGGIFTIKRDLCLDCHKEFIFEIFIWRVIPPKPKRKKKSKFRKWLRKIIKKFL